MSNGINSSRSVSRRGSIWSVFKSELGKSINCFGPKHRLNNDSNVYGSASAGINGTGTGNGVNGSGYRYGRPANGSEAKSGKNGHSNYFQSQALLRKENEENNSQL